MHSIPRRTFLQSVAVATAGAVLPAGVRAAQPVTRNGKPFFKLSLAAYSFHRELTQSWPKPKGKPGKMTLLDFIDFCGEQDVAGTELTSYYFPPEVTPAYLRTVQGRAFRLGLDISGTAIGNDFCKPAGPELDAEIEMTRRWIDYAAQLGAPVIRIFAGQAPQGSEAAALDRCVASINECVKYAGEQGVALALENHGGITATPEQLLAIVSRVDDSPWFGVNFDSGNFRTADPYADLERIAPYAINAQIKVSMQPPGGREPADLQRIVQMLRRANYRGYLVLEYEEAEDPRVEIPKHLAQLRDLIA